MNRRKLALSDELETARAEKRMLAMKQVFYKDKVRKRAR